MNVLFNLANVISKLRILLYYIGLVKGASVCVTGLYRLYLTFITCLVNCKLLQDKSIQLYDDLNTFHKR